MKEDVRERVTRLVEEVASIRAKNTEYLSHYPRELEETLAHEKREQRLVEIIQELIAVSKGTALWPAGVPQTQFDRSEA